LLLVGPAAWAGNGSLEIRDGYFWDPVEAKCFVPRGVAYQTWNPPVGADQSLAQLEYDLTEIRKLHANSIRCEVVWNIIESEEGRFEWEKPDALVAAAERVGLKLFVLVGFQFAPSWFTNHPGWLAVDHTGSNSVILNYEHPGVREVYARYVGQITGRYRNSDAIGAWILGNEYAYFDLWSPERYYVGFDPISLASYQRFLADQYAGDIEALNAAWGSRHAGFGEIPMARQYPRDRLDPGYHDLNLWREHSIGEYVAVGAVAAKRADPNHLRTYSMVGGIFGETDANYTCEDGRTIVERCRVAGAPLDFWSINNYASATFGTDLRSGDYGIARHQADTGLPVLVSETGHTDTETLWDGPRERQARAIPGQMWEALMSGAIGTHVFTWNDRPKFADYFMRERGFGFVHQDRRPKQPAFDNLREMFRRMEQLNVDRLFGGSSDPPPDIQFYWSKASMMGWVRANWENAMLWGPLKRLGYQPGFLDDRQFEQRAYTNAPVLVLSRAFKLTPEHLERLVSDVVPSGVHLHVNADLPGQFDTYWRANPGWSDSMRWLLGLEVEAAYPGFDSGATTIEHRSLHFQVVQDLGPLRTGVRDEVRTWKIWHQITPREGTTVAVHRGVGGAQAPMPALHLKDQGTARVAVNTFALGDLVGRDDPVPEHFWDVHYDWLRAIYRDYFGLIPRLELAGPGARYVIADYRICANGSLLISLLNGHTESAEVRLTAPRLLAGKVVENLTRGGIVETQSDGVVDLGLAGDGYLLLYAYAREEGLDRSLLSTFPDKLWFVSAPGVVRPQDPGDEVVLGYEVGGSARLRVTLEGGLGARKVYFDSGAIAVSGTSTQAVALRLPDADLQDVFYESTPDGGRYRLRAWLENDAGPGSEVTLPVRLVWGVRPLAELPEGVLPGIAYSVTLEWQELSSYTEPEPATPLARPDLWKSIDGQAEHYLVVLELQDPDGEVLARDQWLTSEGTGQHTFTIQAPPTVPVTARWMAYLRPIANASVDLFEDFEDRGPGARLVKGVWDDYDFISPWVEYVNSENPQDSLKAQWQNSGVQAGPGRFVGDQSAFVVATNPPTAGSWSVLGLSYTYALS